MDSPSKQSRELRDIKQARYPKPPEYEVYANETHTKQRDVTKKKIQYRKGPQAENQLVDDSLFQIPENDKSRYFPEVDSFDKPTKFNEKQHFNVNQPEDPSRIRMPNTNKHDQGAGLYPGPSKYDRFGNQKNTTNFEKEHITKQINYPQQPLYTNNQNYPNKGIVSEAPGLDVGKNSSLICKAINYDGEPVTVNDEVIRDKLILSCRPRSHYGPGGYLRKPPNVESERLPKYVYPSPEVTVIDDVNIRRTTDIEYQHKIQEQQPYLGAEKSVLVRNNAYDMGSLGMGEHPLENEKQGEKYEEQYRGIQCKRYTRNFKVFLWGLFIINTLLVLVGLALLLITLIHVLHRDYINTVIGQTGFVNWIWATMVLALLIIIVGTYGIVTSITRSRVMLLTYCIVAFILALIIVIFLVIFWFSHSSLKLTEQSSMKTTFNIYRCHRWVREGWDNLQEKFQCCGVEARGDWKYIPPSCCHAETRFQKLACIGHFIHEDQAFKAGCRNKLEDYFTTMFLLITCLLVLALILLLLGILAALRLLKMYKIILLCREMYMITP